MGMYAAMYRLGYTPWERYGPANSRSITDRLDHEVAERNGRPGRALDVGCGRGQYTTELVARGWDVVGVDYAPQAIEAAQRKGIDGARFVVGDVTALDPHELGTFDFFFDIGCFQGLDAEQRAQAGRSITALANEDATLLMMEFGATRWRRMAGGVALEEIEAALPDWRMLSVEPAETAGLGWPMSRMSPTWYRLARRE